MNDILFPVCIFLAGAISSFINVMAGGGSILTLGVMMLFGLDGSVANGTNRIGILTATSSGMVAFKTERYGNIKESAVLGLCALPGALIGSYYAVSISNVLFQRLLSVVMIFIIITLFLPKKKNHLMAEKSRSSKIFLYPAMFIVGLYGGFIQAGVGFLIMASLRHLTSISLIKINMHKVYIIFMYTVPVLIIFGITGNINWFYAICLGAGNSIGAWLSVKLSIRKGEKAVKILLAVAILLMAVKFMLTW